VRILCNFLCLISFIPLFSLPVKAPQSARFSFHPYTDQVRADLLVTEGNYPFTDDVTFRHYSDHILDIIQTEFDPEVVKLGDSIYLADFLIPWFVSEIHPKIKHPYILISNDTDLSLPPPEIVPLLADSKLAFWFCRNMMLSHHPKIRQIPIGQSVILWSHLFSKERLSEAISKKGVEKKHLLYLNMRLKGRPIRSLVAQLFQDESYCFSRIQKLTVKSVSMEQYYQDLSESHFVLAPPGFGPDIVRFWEAISLGCIPIVRHSELDEVYSDLPVLFVHEWEAITESFLWEKLKEIKSKNFSIEKAYFDYWLSEINCIKASIRSQSNSFSYVESTKFPVETLRSFLSVCNRFIGPNEALLCRGSAMGLRPYEIATSMPQLARIFIQDRYDSIGTTDKRQKKVAPDDSYFSIEHRVNNTHVYLDLTYRSCGLKDDLEELCLLAPAGILILGNRAQDPYVNEILEIAAEKYKLSIQFESDIWYILK
jgi:hypothetical protein